MTDEFAPAYSVLVIATKSRTRYWDGDAVRTEHAASTHQPGDDGLSQSTTRMRPRHPTDEPSHRIALNPAGAPLLDYWILPTEPYRGSHYATFPRNLVVPLVKALCPPGGTVLDPFAGSGTTLLVADGHGRNAIGIDLDERNALLAQERCGMFLTVEHLNAAHRCEAPAVP